jgi:hypothetical protein
MTKSRGARFVTSIKFHLFVFWNIAFGVTQTVWKKPFLPIAVIDFFDVTIVPNFCHEIYLRFSALGGMPGRTSWLLKSPNKHLTVLE